VSAGFTPGPWHHWRIGNGKTICVLGPKFDHDKPIVTWMGFDGCNRKLNEQDANARLIAAAPELYNGCNALLGLIQLLAANPETPPALLHILTEHHRIIEAERAVAKARGELAEQEASR
jgi:hypothetical protein